MEKRNIHPDEFIRQLCVVASDHKSISMRKKPCDEEIQHREHNKIRKEQDDVKRNEQEGKTEHAYSQLVEKCVERFPSAGKDFVVKKVHSYKCCFRSELKSVLDFQKPGTSAE
jgi:hypothetical protein